MAATEPRVRTVARSGSDLSLTCMFVGGEVSGERRCSRWSHDTQSYGRPPADPIIPATMYADPGSLAGLARRPRNLLLVPLAGIFAPWGRRWGTRWGTAPGTLHPCHVSPGRISGVQRDVLVRSAVAEGAAGPRVWRRERLGRGPVRGKSPPCPMAALSPPWRDRRERAGRAPVG